MPRKRWKGTTAKRISNIVNMFDIVSQESLQNAINILRGKSKY